MSSTTPTTSYSSMNIAPPPSSSSIPQVSMIVTQSITGPPIVTKSSPRLDDPQPVDLVSVKRATPIATPLKIPVPRATSSIRPQNRPSGIISVPKIGSLMQVVQPGGNKATVLQTAQVAPKIVSTGSSQGSAPNTNGPRLASGQTVIRGTMQVAPYPMTIRASQASPTGSIRLTSSPQGNPPVQFVPVSLPNAPINQLGTVSVRPGVAFRQDSATVSPVRVTLMQQPVSGMKVSHQMQGVGHQSAVFKPMTSTPTITSASLNSNQTPVRIAPISASRMGVVPVSSQGLTVSMPSASSQMASYGAHNLVTAKSSMTPQGQRVPVPIMTSGGVTIQKMPINVSVPSPQMTVSRTVALPFSTATTIVSANPSTIGKIISNSQTAIPVARVCPQQPTPVSSNNLVTISATGHHHLAAQIDANILIRRMTPAPPTSQYEINVSASEKSGEMRPYSVVGMPKISLPTQPTRLVGYHQSLQAGSSNFGPSLPDHSFGDQQQQLRVQTGMARPSILRRRDGEREIATSDGTTSPYPRPDGQEDGNESALSSPEIAPSSLLCTEELLLPNQISSLNGGTLSVEPSPRKKPRKQQLDNVRELKWSESDEKLMPEELKRKLAKPSNSNAHHRPLPELSQVKDEDDDDFDVEEEDEEEDEDDAEEEENDDENTRLTPKASLIDDNRFLWKCRYTYHFIHDSHVKGKDERKPTVNDLANQKDILQKLDGWKIRYLTAQLYDIIDEESDLTQNLEDFQRRLDKAAHPDISGRRELAKVQELIKANLQRSKAIRDQINEAKDTTMEIFSHKSKVAAIVQKYESKRSLKKKVDLSI